MLCQFPHHAGRFSLCCVPEHTMISDLIILCASWVSAGTGPWPPFSQILGSSAVTFLGRNYGSKDCWKLCLIVPSLQINKATWKIGLIRSFTFKNGIWYITYNLISLGNITILVLTPSPGFGNTDIPINIPFGQTQIWWSRQRDPFRSATIGTCKLEETHQYMQTYYQSKTGNKKILMHT